MATVTATASLLVARRPVLTLVWRGDPMNPRPHAALLHRIAASVEEELIGTLWRVVVDTEADTLALELPTASETEIARAVAVLGGAAAKVNANGDRLARPRSL